MGIFKLGFLANLLSHPVVSGFITASGIIIATSQLKSIFGIKASGAAMPELVKTKGSFVAISSDAGVQGAQGFAAYATSKHALHGLIKCMALDYGPQGVRSHAVCPAFVETPMADELLASASPEEVAFFKKAIPLGRFAKASEVADAVAHLTSNEAAFANGVFYRLDGGATAGYFLAV